MASAERVSNHDFRRRASKRTQEAKASQVVGDFVCLWHKLQRWSLGLALLLMVCCSVGCQSSGRLPFWSASDNAVTQSSKSESSNIKKELSNESDSSQSVKATKSNIRLASFQTDEADEADELIEPVSELDSREPQDLNDDEVAPGSLDDETSDNADDRQAPATNDVPFEYGNSLDLMSVIRSTVDFYPEIEAVMREIGIAEGEIITAEGGFDTKFKIDSESTPVGFYETFRNKFGLEQPTFNGGSLFAGYKFGRGDMEPWYLERNTNAGGELSLGAGWALLRGRDIDARRVSLWKANLNLQAAQPAIRFQLLLACRDAQIAYWNWVAAGQLFRLNKRLLDVAKDRVDGIEERILEEDLAPLSRTDNNRTIVSREVKLTKARAKLEQAAIKLSLYYRDANGVPLIPDASQIPDIETTVAALDQAIEGLVAEALSCRPELQTIDLEIRRIRLDIAKARNDLLPSLNARVAVSQDFGRPTSASAAASSSGAVFANFDEKDEFQVDAGLFLGQDLQRRKATGKIRSLCNKLQQLQIKSEFLQQKIEAEVRQNFRLTAAAAQQIEQAQQARELAEELARAARDRYVDGDVDLFETILREGQELDAANSLVEALFSFHANRANLNASIGCDEYQLFNAVLQN